MLRSTAYKSRPRKLQRASGRGGGAEGRALKLQEMVTKLIRYERIESTLPRCDEARGYTEQLISLAIQNGDKDRHTMEMADYWLTEKDLIHKLFKVLVPRYSHYTNYNFTQTYRLPNKFPGTANTSMAVLELKCKTSSLPVNSFNPKDTVGLFQFKVNPWPPVVPKQDEKKYLLTNILLTELNKEMKKEGKVDTKQQLLKVAFPDEYEVMDNVSPAGNYDNNSVGQSASTESADQLASAELADQMASTESADQVSSIESEQLASSDLGEQSDIKADDFQNQDKQLSDADGENKDNK